MNAHRSIFDERRAGRSGPADSIVAGGLRLDIGGGQGARVARQRTAVVVPPPPVASPHFVAISGAELPGREDQLEAAMAAVGRWHPLGVHAPPGFGKTSLLRQLSSLLASGQPPGAVVRLRVGDTRVEDLLQRVFQSIYRPTDLVMPSGPELVELLGRAESVVLLDDVTLSEGALDEVLESLSSCAVILASERPIPSERCTWLELPGLGDDAALDLVAMELGELPMDHERDAVLRLSRAVGGQPLALRLASAFVREIGLSFAELAEQAAIDPVLLERLSVQPLGAAERQALAVLALAPGAPLPTELVSAMTGTTADRHLATLDRCGIADRENDRYAMTACNADDRRSLLEHLDAGKAIRGLAGWLERRPLTSQKARAAVPAALAAIVLGAEHGDWPAVVRLVGGIEPILALAGRWEAWRDVLDQGLEASQLAGDSFAEADFSHQLGCLELCAGNTERARVLLESALRKRTTLGDRRAVEVSSANLRLLTPTGPDDPQAQAAPAAPPRSRTRSLFRRRTQPQDQPTGYRPSPPPTADQGVASPATQRPPHPQPEGAAAKQQAPAGSQPQPEGAVAAKQQAPAGSQARPEGVAAKQQAPASGQPQPEGVAAAKQQGQPATPNAAGSQGAAAGQTPARGAAPDRPQPEVEGRAPQPVSAQQAGKPKAAAPAPEASGPAPSTAGAPAPARARPGQSTPAAPASTPSGPARAPASPAPSTVGTPPQPATRPSPEPAASAHATSSPRQQTQPAGAAGQAPRTGPPPKAAGTAPASARTGQPAAPPSELRRAASEQPASATPQPKAETEAQPARERPDGGKAPAAGPPGTAKPPPEGSTPGDVKVDSRAPATPPAKPTVPQPAEAARDERAPVPPATKTQATGPTGNDAKPEPAKEPAATPAPTAATPEVPAAPLKEPAATTTPTGATPEKPTATPGPTGVKPDVPAAAPKEPAATPAPTGATLKEPTGASAPTAAKSDVAAAANEPAATPAPTGATPVVPAAPAKEPAATTTPTGAKPKEPAGAPAPTAAKPDAPAAPTKEPEATTTPSGAKPKEPAGTPAPSGAKPKEPTGTPAQTTAKPQEPAASAKEPAGTSAPAGAGREAPAGHGAAPAAAQAAAEPAEAGTDAPAPNAAMKPSVTPASEAPVSKRTNGGGKTSGTEAGGEERSGAPGALGRAPEKGNRRTVGPSAKGAAGGRTGEASGGRPAAGSGEADDVSATPPKAIQGQNGSGRRDAPGTEAQEADAGDVDRRSGNGLPDGQERSGVDGKAGAARPMADWATSGTYDNPAIWAGGASADAGGQGTETAGAARRLPPRVRGVLAIVAGVLFSVVLVAVVAITNPPGKVRDEARRDTQVSPATTAPATTPGKAAPGAPKEWTLEPVAVDFGQQAVGTSGEVRTLFIRNGSAKSGKIVAISIEGDQSQYEVDTRCAGVALASGFRCRIAVRFAPSAIGEHHARVRISFDGRPTQASTVLFGTATR